MNRMIARFAVAFVVALSLAGCTQPDHKSDVSSPQSPLFVEKCRIEFMHMTGSSANSDAASAYCSCVTFENDHIRKTLDRAANVSEHYTIVSMCKENVTLFTQHDHSRASY